MLSLLCTIEADHHNYIEITPKEIIQKYSINVLNFSSISIGPPGWSSTQQHPKILENKIGSEDTLITR